MAEIMQIGRILQGRNVKVYFLFIEEEYEGMLIYILRSKMYHNCRNAVPLPYALTASSIKLVQTNVFICNYSHYIASSLLDSRLPVI
jgi:hypothetical protein